MRITRKSLLLFIAQLIPLVGLLFLFTDLVGSLFVGEDYHVRGWFRCKVLAYLVAFTSAYLTGTNVAHSNKSAFHLVTSPL